MALLHWYIMPIGIELEFNPLVLDNFSHFVGAVEMAMTTKPRSEVEFHTLHHLLCTFLEGFQRIYIGDNPEKVSWFRLCIFQVIHVPIHIQWNGSIRVGSKATVERAIGEVGHKIHSKKSHLPIWPISYLKRNWSSFYFCIIQHLIQLQPERRMFLHLHMLYIKK
jgi:hypothetical protein